MQKHRLLGGTLALCILAAAAGCADSEEKIETTAEVATTAEIPTRDVTVYEPVLEEFREALAAGFSETDLKYAAEGTSQLEYIPEDSTVYFAYCDIDGNGVEELLIGAGNEDGIGIYELWGVNDGEPQRLFSDYVFGYKNLCSICENGVIEICWQDGTAHTGYDFYRISEDGFTVELLESISSKLVGYEENTLDTKETEDEADEAEVSEDIRYYHGNEEITGDEYANIVNGYKTIDISWEQL